jgi:hypothetical protein
MTRSGMHLTLILIALLSFAATTNAGFSATRVAPLELVELLDDDDDDDQPSPRPGRTTEPAPRPSFTQRIQRELRIGYVWVNQQGTRVTSLRASLEFRGRTVAAMTLEPKSGAPLALGTRVAVTVGTRYTPEALNTILQRLRASSGQALQLGRFSVPTARGVRTPVFWQTALVTHLYTRNTDGELLSDPTVILEIRGSALKVR